MMKHLLVIIVFFGFVLQCNSQGYILPAGVVYVGNGGSGYGIDVRQNSTNASFIDYTGFFLNPVGKTRPQLTYFDIFSYSYIVDEGVRVFLVRSNEPISLQPILSASWLELGSSSNYIFTNGVPFYLALYTGYGCFALTNINGSTTSYYTGIYNPAVYGWVKLVNNLGTIQMLDGAMEYGGAGIIAGTQNVIAVPEPSGLGLMGLGLIYLMRHMSQRFHSARFLKRNYFFFQAR